MVIAREKGPILSVCCRNSNLFNVGKLCRHNTTQLLDVEVHCSLWTNWLAFLPVLLILPFLLLSGVIFHLNSLNNNKTDSFPAHRLELLVAKGAKQMCLASCRKWKYLKLFLLRLGKQERKQTWWNTVCEYFLRSSLNFFIKCTIMLNSILKKIGNLVAYSCV